MSTVQERVHSLYCNQGLHDPGLLLGSVTDGAIDYLEQAPVLALVATYGRNLRRRAVRSVVAQWFGSALSQRKLTKVLRYYKLPLPLRKLTGNALAPKYIDVIQRLARMNPSTLAQIIPDSTGQQRVWLSSLWMWNFSLGKSHRYSQATFEWAAREFAGAEDWSRDRARDLADLFHNSDAQFNYTWSLGQAIAAQERWHLHLAKEKGEREFFESFKVGFSDAIDYAPFPAFANVSGYEFYALNSGELLFQEGIAMHHCVASYSKAVIWGQSRIFSMRQNGKRVATAEYTFQKGHYRPFQIKGPCNAARPKSVHAAAARFAIVVAEGRT